MSSQEMAFQFQDARMINKDAVLRGRPRSPDRFRPGGRPPSRGPVRPLMSRPLSAAGRASAVSKPEAWKIFDIILDEYKGKSRISEVQLLFPKTWNNVDIREWLEHDQRFSAFTDNTGTLKFVSVHCRARLCVHYGQGSCSREDCGNFHYCRSFLAGHCKMGQNCRYFHGFDNEHNLKLRRRLHLGKYNNQQMKIILRHSVIQVCLNYNSTDGCRMNDGCTFLHVCKEFVMRECTKDNCTLEHSFEGEHTSRLLKTCGLMNLKDKNLNLLRKNILTRKEEGHSAKQDAEKMEVRKVHPRDSSDYIAKIGAAKPYGTESSVTDDQPEAQKPNPNDNKGNDRSSRSKRTRKKSGTSRKASAFQAKDAVDTSEEKPSGESPESPKPVFDTEEIWLKPSKRYSSGEGASPETEVHDTEYQPVLDKGKVLPILFPMPNLSGLKPGKSYKSGEGASPEFKALSEDGKADHQPILDKSRIRPKIPPKPRWSKNKEDSDIPVYICDKQPFGKTCEAPCRDFHCRKKFAWFVHSDGKWQQFEAMEEDKLENAYFNPVEASWHAKVCTYFVDMIQFVGSSGNEDIHNIGM